MLAVLSDRRGGHGAGNTEWRLHTVCGLYVSVRSIRLCVCGLYVSVRSIRLCVCGLYVSGTLR